MAGIRNWRTVAWLALALLVVGIALAVDGYRRLAAPADFGAEVDPSSLPPCRPGLELKIGEACQFTIEIPIERPRKKETGI